MTYHITVNLTPCASKYLYLFYSSKGGKKLIHFPGNTYNEFTKQRKAKVHYCVKEKQRRRTDADRHKMQCLLFY